MKTFLAPREGADAEAVGLNPAEIVNEQALLCPKCRVALPDALFNRGEFAPCPNCGVAVRCEVFPAQYAGPRVGSPGELLVDASEASCFFHPEKKAAVACDSCGRFLCALCDLDFLGRHICARCLAAGRKKGSLGNLDHFRLSWGGLALLLTAIPFAAISLHWYRWGVVTAVAALVVAIVGWRKPRSLTGRRRVVTLILALLISLAEVAAAIWWAQSALRTFLRG